MQGLLLVPYRLDRPYLLRLVQVYHAWNEMDGWLSDPQAYWWARFHRDPCGGWAKDQRVFVDHGRPMPDGQPALLRTRREMRYEDAVALWFQLKSLGWTVADAAW